MFQYPWYQGFIPEQIKISRAVNVSGKRYFLSSCGAAIFKMTDASAKRISQDGLIFLQDAIYTRNRELAYPKYKQWKATPLEHAWTSDGYWFGLNCSKASRTLTRKIFDAAKNEGSYYAVNSEGMILVIPHLKLVVFSYRFK